MWNLKNKAITFSFDDGIKQDIKLIEILDKYNLKATFNLNSACFGSRDEIDYEGKHVIRDRVDYKDIKEVYKNHEVAAHTLQHHLLTTLEDSSLIYSIKQDQKVLSEIVGYEVYGLAYPCGGINHDKRVVELIRNNTNTKYARTITSTYSFDLPKDLIELNPTVYFREVDKLFELAHEFVNLKTDTPKLFYIWGHAYELDFPNGINYEKFEELCKIIANKDDIFYGTNREVLL